MPSDACRALLGPLVEGRLCFDVGAHVGTHAHDMLELGATRVVALEPQPWERKRIIPNERLVVLPFAASNVGGTGLLHVARETYVSTLEDSYPARVQAHAPYDYIGDLPVRRITLDYLVARFGLPGFVKVDVEGYERQVLSGLSVPVDALSFEIHNFDETKPADCMRILERLCSWGFFYSPRESYLLEPWTASRQLEIFGDVYALRRL